MVRDVKQRFFSIYGNTTKRGFWVLVAAPPLLRNGELSPKSKDNFGIFNVATLNLQLILHTKTYLSCLI